MMKRLVRTGSFDLLVEEGADKYALLRELLNLRGLSEIALLKNADGGVVVGDASAHASVSDCGELAAAVLSLAGPIGVDVQGGPARPRVAQKFFSRRELSLDFNLVWARKEAYAKWLGTGLDRAILAMDTCDLNNFVEYDLAEWGWEGHYLVICMRADGKISPQ